MLSDLDLGPTYRSDRNSLLRDFYLPCVSEAVEYSRAVGYFSSDALSGAMRGLHSLAARGGRVRLVASPHLSMDDVAAIREGYQRREEVIAQAVTRALALDDIPEQVKNRLALLSWMIAAGLLDIKIALVEGGNGLGLYHEKIGIFRDEAGNQVVFTGSANESVGGLITNFESIEVYRSWIAADIDRIEPKVADFEALWADRTPGLKIYPFPEAARRVLLKLRPPYLPPHDPEELEWATLPIVAGIGPTIPAGLAIRDYQKEAVQRWFANQGRGTWRMATGTGKTITSLAAMVQLYRALRQQGQPLVAVVVCPFQHLVSQWVETAERFNIRPVACFQAYHQWHEPLQDALARCGEGIDGFACIVATNATFQGERFQQALGSLPARSAFLFVADEAHNVGAQQLRQLLPEAARYRLALSATPERWYDDEGTAAILDYFGPVIYELGLAEAIRLGALTPYIYHPVVVELEDDELSEYVEISQRIARVAGVEGGELTDETPNEMLKSLLIRRARIVALARAKLPALRERFLALRGSGYNLVYCSEGRGIYPPSPSPVRQLDAVVRLLGNDLGMAVNSYTAETYLDQRTELRQQFALGRLQALVAIRCLDEGVDIPETRRAFILASSTNPRQFIQRRGRILRRAAGKDQAEIHDFLVVPPEGTLSDELFEIERRLVRREFERVVLFARLALNGPEALSQLLPLRQRYHLLDLG